MLPAPSQRGQETILKEVVVVGCGGVFVIAVTINVVVSVYYCDS